MTLIFYRLPHRGNELLYVTSDDKTVGQEYVLKKGRFPLNLQKALPGRCIHLVTVNSQYLDIFQ